MKDIEYGSQVAIMIGDIYRNWRGAIDAIAKSYQVTRTEWHIISKLHCQSHKLSQAELCDMVGINNAQLTRALNQLENRNMIIRTMDKNNRRSNFVELKDRNAQYIQDIEAINLKINNILLCEFTSAEQKQLTKSLQKLSSVTQDIGSKIDPKTNSPSSHNKSK